MARRKTLAIISTSKAVLDMCQQFNCDPLERMFKLLTYEIPIPDSYTDEDIKALPGLEAREIHFDEKTGKRRAVLKTMHQFEIAKELAQYVHSKKKSSETREEGGYTLNVLIRTFAEPEKKTIVLEQKAIPAEIVDEP
jgi:hypothetical protein